MSPSRLTRFLNCPPLSSSSSVLPRRYSSRCWPKLSGLPGLRGSSLSRFCWAAVMLAHRKGMPPPAGLLVTISRSMSQSLPLSMVWADQI